MNNEQVDILILSNGPGEVTTWVRPVVESLRQQLGEDRERVRISVVLSPCPNATGKEAAIARSYPQVDRVQAAEHFFPFLLSGKTAQNWDWRDKGVVLFLGGDQFYTVIIGKRLGYRTVVYAEWDARWHNWIDRFGVMKEEIALKASPKYAPKFTVVGDLMAEATSKELSQLPITDYPLPTELIGLLPGSKPAKLAQGVPFCLAIAQRLHSVRPQSRFVIPVAPTLDLTTLASFADPNHNPLIQQFGWGCAELIIPSNSNSPFLKTPTGLCVELFTQFPAYDLLSQCRLCLTTVGANTAELGSLAVPMIVLLPTQQLDAMRSWDGLPGLLANLPGVGSVFAKAINSLVLRQGRLFAWPNKWANSQIVPELVGNLQPQAVANLVIDYLDYPQKLEAMRSNLRHVRGNPGASQKLAQLVLEELSLFDTQSPSITPNIAHP
ncbi:MAG TPA: lipid-A-disaccharide synthase [Cyanobacteria bacterium UBA11369]|nr:lipid-A-disaccharide synthase [Cyanobacteria bacterium UBA11371]HBE33273.1 lipid-A-disaccharide synthase [Cyanobacteria bacterium UBA11368]HBE50944.1 lipid-A-disaccharide synthase [Cyanobacteria bacterium UBA11369]